ncbi:GNAT family N-acetyltransferase [Aureicoccus marinus]|uniref:GNAT family N-acetyltransferase n=1 Tax=Aureicoccus marinus TaxID=754435 RepID=A0A2S7T4E9_9FLAO|nr:GNAT family N-acetyltransferase [Aureicoccus marinus]PQJ14365.1 GNAT family N-acetyltransferase [Aureicoccus marinus]
MGFTVTNNAENKRYQAEVEGHLVKIDYLVTKNKIYLTHTEVPQVLEGRGIGKTLVEAALNDIEAQEKQLVPLCPFVAAYLKRHPDWARILAPGFNVS